MARIDKYDGKVGGFRAKLGWAPVAAEVGDIIGVTINGSGLAVKAAAGTADAVVCMSSLLAQNDPIDCMTAGEIVDVTNNDNVTGRAAGVEMFAGAAGAVTNTGPGAGVNGVRIGRFIEDWRLVVRVQKVQG